jgi:hypothetical protein
VETDSHGTAHTTIQSYETANPGAGSRSAVSVGIFAGIVRPVTLAVSQANLGSCLRIQKFRSCGRVLAPMPAAAGNFGSLGG